MIFKGEIFMYDIEKLWYGMKARCNSVRHAAYEDCTVCDEWMHSYKSFEKWFISNLYNCNGEQLEIDKDLFSRGKKIYSPETCCLLPKAINIALSYKRKRKNSLPCGVHKTKNGKYSAMIHRQNGHLTKTFDSVEAARDFYIKNKERHIKELALAYERYLPEHIFDALWRYKCNESYHVTPVTKKK